MSGSASPDFARSAFPMGMRVSCYCVINPITDKTVLSPAGKRSRVEVKNMNISREAVCLNDSLCA